MRTLDLAKLLLGAAILCIVGCGSDDYVLYSHDGALPVDELDLRVDPPMMISRSFVTVLIKLDEEWSLVREDHRAVDIALRHSDPAGLTVTVYTDGGSMAASSFTYDRSRREGVYVGVRFGGQVSQHRGDSVSRVTVKATSPLPVRTVVLHHGHTK